MSKPRDDKPSDASDATEKTAGKAVADPGSEKTDDAHAAPEAEPSPVTDAAEAVEEAERPPEDSGAPEGEAEPVSAAEAPEEEIAPETGYEPEPHPEPEPVHAADEAHEDDHSGPTVAGRILRFLVVLLIGAGLALWVAPKIAPHVPNSVARYLAPSVDVANEELAALRTALDEERATSEARAAALAARIGEMETALETSGDDTAQDEAIAALRSELTAAQETIAALGPEVEAAGTAARGVREELDSLQSALATLEPGVEGEGTGATSSEVASAVAALASKVEALDQRMAGLAEKSALEALQGRLSAAETALTEAAAAQEAAAAEAESAAKAAEVTRAAAALSRALVSGEPFAEALAELETASGTAAPEALAGTAEAGLALPSELRGEIGPRAHDAISRSISAEREGVLGDAETWLRSRFTGRPVTEQEGDDVGAILSRVEARLKEDDLAAALAEAETLPEDAQAALGDWLERLRARVAAERALSDYLETIGASGSEG